MKSEESIAFILSPVDCATRPMTFAFSISIAGRLCWPMTSEDAVPIQIQLDDLFAYLVEFWRPLLLRQTYPFGLKLIRPSLVSRAAAERWEKVPQDVMEEEAAVLAAFEDAHDLSRAFGGMFDLPPFWILREGDKMICDGGREFWRLPFHSVAAELTRVGDYIADYLMRVAPERWDAVVDAWKRRGEIDAVDLVAWCASVEPDVAEELIECGAITAPNSLTEAVNDDDPLLIAARMAGELPTVQIVRIIAIAKSFEAHDAPELEKLSRFCLDLLGQESRTMPPHSQGETVARELRRYFKCESNDRIDIFDIASTLGIEVRSDSVELNTFDGLAIAGGCYGPGAFLNRRSLRLGRDSSDLANNGGARVTLAHELCHLLLDRMHPLSAIEILRSRMPAGVESRARAFAGELLLPTSAASDYWQRSGSPFDVDGLKTVLQKLVRRFKVTFSVAAWKVEHASGPNRNKVGVALDAIAQYR
jgi:hypothetical protein